MKKLTLIGLLIGALAVGMIIGAFVGGRLVSIAFARIAYSKPEIDTAAHAAQVAEWLAEFRLGESTNAISDMENDMNIQMETLAAWDSFAPPDEQTRKARDRWLSPVKVYRESYPASGSDMAHANALLSTIPGRSSTSTCKSGVCRLDDLRLAKLRSVTNSP